ncbi:hypothetical protein [Daejeonella oryzae]|uniref:hypothetical protein n=1 Tax=Daejeonella oryzae TaxID=1122943 RepID=UPI0004225E35|nr:hypothetical protein [Daejeonella oryzae]
MNNQTEHSRWGIIGGTLVSILINLSLSDLLSTVFLAAVGASVSYAVSLLLKRYFPEDKFK